jgi:hypothetical protein
VLKCLLVIVVVCMPLQHTRGQVHALLGLPIISNITLCIKGSLGNCEAEPKPMVRGGPACRLHAVLLARIPWTPGYRDMGP